MQENYDIQIVQLQAREHLMYLFFSGHFVCKLIQPLAATQMNHLSIYLCPKFWSTHPSVIWNSKHIN